MPLDDLAARMGRARIDAALDKVGADALRFGPRITMDALVIVEEIVRQPFNQRRSGEGFQDQEGIVVESGVDLLESIGIERLLLNSIQLALQRFHGDGGAPILVQSHGHRELVADPALEDRARYRVIEVAARLELVPIRGALDRAPSFDTIPQAECARLGTRLGSQ